MNGTWITEFWLGEGLDPVEFKSEFENWFPGGKAEKIEEAEGEEPGYSLYELRAPLNMKDQLDPFLLGYAERHDAVYKQGPPNSSLSISSASRKKAN